MKHTNKKLEIIVGIPSLNEAATISTVTKSIDEGLIRYFPNYNSLIVNLDNHSKDNTKENFLNTKTVCEKKYISTSKEKIGKGYNIRNLFELVSIYSPKAVLMIDSDHKKIPINWIDLLITPIVNGQDLVCPVYKRHPLDGTITNHLCYPLIKGFFDINLRQPIGGDFGMSCSLCNYILNQSWETEVFGYGIDIFITLQSILNDFQISEANLGIKEHNSSYKKLHKMFQEVSYTLFFTLSENIHCIRNKSKIHLSPLANHSVKSEVADISFNVDRIKCDFSKMFQENEDFIKSNFPDMNIKILNHVNSFDNQ